MTLVGNWARCPLSLRTDDYVTFVNVSSEHQKEKNRATVRIPQVYGRHHGGWGGSTLLAPHLLYSHPPVGKEQREKEEKEGGIFAARLVQISR